MKDLNQPLRIAAICGSLRTGSFTRAALEIALRGAAETGMETHLIDLRDYQLVFCDGKSDASDYPNDVARLRRDVAAANGLILGTPEYHGGYSGVLKNALDLMGFDEFQGRVVGLIAISGGELGGFGPLVGLRNVCRALHAWVVPEQALVPRAWDAFDESGRPKSSDLEGRLRAVGIQVARFTYLHCSSEAREFMREWERAFENPGGEGR